MYAGVWLVSRARDFIHVSGLALIVISCGQACVPGRTRHGGMFFFNGLSQALATEGRSVGLSLEDGCRAVAQLAEQYVS
jgi:hypothetical protein